MQEAEHVPQVTICTLVRAFKVVHITCDVHMCTCVLYILCLYGLWLRCVLILLWFAVFLCLLLTVQPMVECGEDKEDGWG